MLISISNPFRRPGEGFPSRFPGSGPQSETGSSRRRSTISVIIVAGACGIAAGTPLAILGAIGRAAKLGSIVKGGIYIEALAKIDTVVLDKTGTATFGKPTLTAIHPADSVDSRELLALAASAERASDHPIALAIVDKANELRLMLREPTHFRIPSGKRRDLRAGWRGDCSRHACLDGPVTDRACTFR